MGLRHGFGLFLQPMSADLHWGRESFALAMAVQNLVWGIMQPFAGMIADRYGTAKVVLAGAILYVLGLVTMAHATTPLALVLTCGVLIGVGLSGVTFSVISGVLGRAYPPERRSMVLGISAAAGSFGQFAMVPATQWLLVASRLVRRAAGARWHRAPDGAARSGAGREARDARSMRSVNPPARRCARRWRTADTCC